MQVLGFMAAAHPVVPLWLLWMQHLQSCYRTTCDIWSPKKPVAGNTAGTSDLLRHCLHGCITDKVGRDTSPTTLPRQPHLATGPQTLKALDTGEASVGEDWQQNNGSLHQHAWRSSVRCPVEEGGKSVVVGLRAVGVYEGSPHSRVEAAEVDLFINRCNTNCPLWFSLAEQDNQPLGVDTFAHVPWTWTKVMIL